MTLDVRARIVRGAFVLEAQFRVDSGSTMALLGPNGAGKSTLVAALAGSLPLESGRITLGDRVLVDPERGVFVQPERRGVGVVHQEGLLFPHLTVRDNVAFPLRAGGESRSRSRKLAQPWIDALGLESLTDQVPGNLSGGEAQRVALARTLAAEPELLVLDEPTAALDVTARTEIRQLLRRHLDEHPGPRILITHDPAEAFTLADQVAIIEAGRITQQGTPAEIRRRPATRYAADLAGINLFTGFAEKGLVTTNGGHELQVADTSIEGPVTLTIHPRSVVCHTRQP
jgi:molybdate transport system ATP-binding protein